MKVVYLPCCELSSNTCVARNGLLCQHRDESPTSKKITYTVMKKTSGFQTVGKGSFSKKFPVYREISPNACSAFIMQDILI